MTMFEPTRLLLIRHGETDWNVEGRVQGQTDIGLNGQGHQQAHRLAQGLAALGGERIEQLYSSDLQRAWQTARVLGSSLRLKVQAEAGLRERHFGAFETKTVSEIHQAWPEQAQQWRSREPHFAPHRGESLVSFSRRCVGAVWRVAARHPGQTVAIVTHGGVLDCSYRSATGLDLQAPRTWTLGNTSVNRLLFHGEGLTLIGWADQSHLIQVSHDEMNDARA